MAPLLGTFLRMQGNLLALSKHRASCQSERKTAEIANLHPRQISFLAPYYSVEGSSWFSSQGNTLRGTLSGLVSPS